MPRLFNHVLFVSTLVACAACAGPEATAPSGRAAVDGPPNIVVLFADDLGYGDLSSYGHPTIETPNLDALGADGARLTSFYAASPVCTPSRAGLLTGRYAQRTGARHVYMPESTGGLDPSEVTIAEMLKEEGYRTMAVGKWHLGHQDPAFLPTAQGFDAYYGLLYSNDMIRPWVQTDQPLRLFRNDQEEGGEVDQTRLTVDYTNEAVRFIEEARDEPFFLYLAYSMPHLPIRVAAELEGRSRAGLYGDVIEALDWSAGQIREALEASGQAGNTIVVFTSDNGPWQNLPGRMLQDGNEPWHAGLSGHLRGAKGTTYEGGLRVPCLIYWPGHIEGGRTLRDMASALDLLPTFAAAAEAEPPSDLDGQNLLPWLTGAAERSPVDTFFYTQGDLVEAVRQGRWKYRLSRMTDGRGMLPEGEARPELFDLEVDPAERYNRIDDEPDVARRLAAALAAFAKSVEAEVVAAAPATPVR